MKIQKIFSNNMNFIIWIYWIYFYICVCMCVYRRVYSLQTHVTACIGSQRVDFTMQILRIKFRWSGLKASALTCWAILLSLTNMKFITPFYSLNFFEIYLFYFYEYFAYTWVPSISGAQKRLLDFLDLELLVVSQPLDAGNWTRCKWRWCFRFPAAQSLI